MSRHASSPLRTLGALLLLVPALSCGGDSTAPGPAAIATVRVTGAPADRVLFIGQKVRLSALVYDAADAIVSGKAVSWSSSNATAAEVSDAGEVTAVGVGATRITATVEGKEGSVELQVRQVPVGSVTIMGPVISIIYGEQAVQLAVTLRDANGGVVTGRDVSWSSSHPTRATVDQSGLVTGAAAGPVTITATSEGRQDSHDLTVLPAPMADWSRATDWTTLQGNASHNGYVPVVVDPRVFAGKWEATVGGPTQTLNPVTAADGHVLVTPESRFGGHFLRILDVATGEQRWSHEFGDIHAVHPPAYGNGRAYVTTSGHEDSYLWAFDAASGQIAFRSPYGNQWGVFYAPVVLDGRVYMAGGRYGGMYAFDATDGTQRWFIETNQYDEWSPAVKDGLVHAYTGSDNPELSVVDAATGQTVYEIPDPGFEWHGWSMETAPALGGADNALVTQRRRLLSFDLAGRRIGWSRTDQFRGMVSIANGTAYVVNGNSVEARAETDGTRVWLWTPPQGHTLMGAVIVTDNLLFASSATATWAIDLQARVPVWSWPAGGHLALSRDGTLLIAQPNGRVAAVTAR